MSETDLRTIERRRLYEEEYGAIEREHRMRLTMSRIFIPALNFLLGIPIGRGWHPFWLLVFAFGSMAVIGEARKACEVDEHRRLLHGIE